MKATIDERPSTIDNSPWIDGPKAVSSYDAVIEKGAGISLADHEAEWGGGPRPRKNAV